MCLNGQQSKDNASAGLVASQQSRRDSTVIDPGIFYGMPN
jgi:hypothetical protein